MHNQSLKILRTTKHEVDNKQKEAFLLTCVMPRQLNCHRQLGKGRRNMMKMRKVMILPWKQNMMTSMTPRANLLENMKYGMQPGGGVTLRFTYTFMSSFGCLHHCISHHFDLNFLNPSAPITLPRCYRYTHPKEGKQKCSDEVLKLWKDPEGRNCTQSDIVKYTTLSIAASHHTISHLHHTIKGSQNLKLA